jgi:acyl-coenzyme A thioesterase PaaI-like protein
VPEPATPATDARPEFAFDAATVAQPLDDRQVAVLLDPQWTVDGRILNGGYLQAVTVRAAAALLGDAGDPVAVSTSFAAPAVAGTAIVTVQVLRRGGRLSSVSATLRQSDTVVLASLVTVGALPSAGSEPAGARDRAPGSAPPIPDVPAARDCLRVPTESLPGPPGLAAVLDLAFVPDRSGWLTGDTSAGPAIRCWLSFADRRPLDPLALVALADMAPPVSFAQGRFGWAPTLHLQVGIFARPRGTEVLLDLRGEPYDGAFVAEDALLWDAEGALVARARQIAVPPRG